jgi:Protein of unknown function (DUF3144)
MSAETDTNSTSAIEDSEGLFFTRADAHIFLSNDQLEGMHKEGVAASMLYASARFTAWLMAGSFTKSDLMQESKAGAVEFFTERFRDMLSQNIDDYITNFDHYLKSPQPPANDAE